MQREKRRLAAIVAADIAGYSRLIGRDEEGTLRALRAHRRELIDRLIEEFGGRIANTAGDSLLLEFPSAVDAVRYTVAVQDGMAARNQELEEGKRIRFRVGIHVGDVVAEGEDLLGDGVNVAARLESLADPGGAALSDDAYRQVRDRLDLLWRDDGEHEVKNMARPVRVWRWSPEGDRQGATAHTGTTLQLPDKPSIAVLPFTNMSGDSEQEYFSDGITEDIITALSKFRWFFVIARNSTFTYKGKAVDVKRVARELGVRYVLEGSVRKAARRVRISAQLIDAESGNHVWAERYDRNLEDIFELQDEITSTIAAAVEPELAGSERERALRKPTDHLGAWDLFQRGVALMWQQNLSGLNGGRQLIRQAIELDPNFGQAYGHLAFGAFSILVYEWTDDREETLRQGVADAGKAIAIDQRDHFAYHALGRLKTMAGEHAAAVRALETCVNINPNFALGYLGLAEAHVYGGDPQKAIGYADTAIRLSPNDPMMWGILHYKASAYVRLDDFDRAIELFEKVCEFPTVQYVPSATLAALYILRGREADGRRALQNALRLEPNLSIALMKNVYGVSRDRPGTRARRLLDALRTAGLPE